MPLSDENKEIIHNAYASFEQECDDRYSELVWELSMQLNVPEDEITEILG